jgi:phosphatidylglycerol---prolipoprotein diacylglyceryl transferase
MFVHNIDPVLVSFWSLEIRYYGLVYAIGFLVLLYTLIGVSKNKRIKGFDDNAAYDVTLYIILGSIFLARLFFELIYNLKDFISYPWQFFFFWNGGMSFHGGIIGGAIGALYFCRKRKINFYDIADIVIIPFSLFLGLGRIANFINGELPGKITNVWWAVKFPGYQGYRHPSQLYEAAKNFFIFGVLMWGRSFKNLKKGTIFWSFVGLYGLLRFLVTFYREAEYYFFGIGIGQWLSLLMVPIAGLMLYRIYRK